MSEMKALPAWPVRPRPIASDAQTIGYERACYIAALARLRVAVEALRDIGDVRTETIMEMSKTSATDVVWVACANIRRANKALSSIGDIP